MAKCVWLLWCGGFCLMMCTLISAVPCDRWNIPGIPGDAGDHYLRMPNNYIHGSHLMMYAANCLAFGKRCFIKPFSRTWKKVPIYSYPKAIWPQRLAFFKTKGKYRRIGAKKIKPTTPVSVTSGTTNATKISDSMTRTAIQKLKRKCMRRFKFHEEGSLAMCLALKNGNTESFSKAQKRCRRWNGRLVVANTEKKIKLFNKFLTTENNKNLFQSFNQKGYRNWIGLKGALWADGSLRIDAKIGNVPIEHNNQMCVSVSTSTFSWTYENCETTYNFFVCELT